MSLLQRAPRLGAAAASALARDLYAVDAVAVELPSERDQNFRLETTGGDRFVLKIANATEDRALLDAQNGAMAPVARATGLCPRVVPAADGAAIAEHGTGAARHFVRLLTWVPGAPLGALRRHGQPLLADLGRRLGEMSHALATFDHPALHRTFH